MRYTEPKERSGELLRLTLSHMGRHDAAFNPLTFTLWYEYAAGGNTALSAAINQLTSDGKRLDDAAVRLLHKAHVVPADEDALERVGGEMRRLMSGMAHSASATGSAAGAFGAQLDGLTAALASQNSDQLRQHLDQVMAGTTEMQTAVEALRSKVTASQGEIDKLRDDLERARCDALIDPLTGILNRKGFDQKLQALLAQEPAPGTSHCLVMLDIDHFKKVNDTHGHLVGDKVIQAVGDILRASVQHPAHAAARYGGEEFAMLLPQTSAEQGVQLAEAVCARTKALIFRNRKTHDVMLSVTLSGGMAEMQRGDDAASLVARADAALYASKNGGRDRVTCA